MESAHPCRRYPAGQTAGNSLTAHSGSGAPWRCARRVAASMLLRADEWGAGTIDLLFTQPAAHGGTIGNRTKTSACAAKTLSPLRGISCKPRPLSAAICLRLAKAAHPIMLGDLRETMPPMRPTSRVGSGERSQAPCRSKKASAAAHSGRTVPARADQARRIHGLRRVFAACDGLNSPENQGPRPSL